MLYGQIQLARVVVSWKMLNYETMVSIKGWEFFGLAEIAS
jgi:hypothetical protein